MIWVRYHYTIRLIERTSQTTSVRNEVPPEWWSSWLCPSNWKREMCIKRNRNQVLQSWTQKCQDVIYTHFEVFPPELKFIKFWVCFNNELMEICLIGWSIHYTLWIIHYSFFHSTFTEHLLYAQHRQRGHRKKFRNNTSPQMSHGDGEERYVHMKPLFKKDKTKIELWISTKCANIKYQCKGRREEARRTLWAQVGEDFTEQVEPKLNLKEKVIFG